MRNNYNLKMRTLSLIMCTLVITALMPSSVIGFARRDPMFEAGIDEAESDSIPLNLVYTFKFEEPDLKKVMINDDAYVKLDLPGTFSGGNMPGSPIFQVKPVKLLLPMGTELVNIDVDAGETVEIDTYAKGIDLMETPVFPYQPPVPIGEFSQEFVFNHEAYQSSNVVPGELYDNLEVGYCRGYTIMMVNLHPTLYNLCEGRFWYHRSMKITLELEETGKANQFYRPNHSGDRQWVESLVCNPEITQTYGDQVETKTYEGGLCSPGDNDGQGYDYVIIAREALYDFPKDPPILFNWSDLIDRKRADGLDATKILFEDIIECPAYWNDNSPTPGFNDTAYLIREFCRDAYIDWGLQYVLIGGDHNTGAGPIPRRFMFSNGIQCETDLYWSNLDNTFNGDFDRYWGEVDDPGFDLFSELFIGSIPCHNEIHVSNWLTKSFYYANSTDRDYLDNAAFYTGAGTNYIDFSAVKGTDDWLGTDPDAFGEYPSWLGFLYGFETWNSENQGNEYNLSVKWTTGALNPGGWRGGDRDSAIQGLRDAINNNQVTLLSGVAHGLDDGMSCLDVLCGDWKNLYHNTKPFFLHAYDCYSGDMDHSFERVVEIMLFDSNLAFACVLNTDYGIPGMQQPETSTNSTSALQQKLFWDYLFDVENNSKSTENWQLGKAQAWSKDAMAPTINWGYSNNGKHVIIISLLFGDPAQTIKPPIQ